MLCRRNERKDDNVTKENADFFLSLGLCSRCGKYKVFGDEKMCPECRARDAEYHAKRYEDPEQKKQMIQAVIKTKNKRKEYRRKQGLCIECGRRKPKEGIATCSICRERINRQKRARYQGATLRKQWVADGKCYLCGDECEKGYQVCREHHQMYIDNAQSKAAAANRKRIKAEGLVTAYGR